MCPMKPLPRNLLIAGLVVSLGGSVVGLIVTVFSMVMAFNHVGQNGISDPHALTGDIGHALVCTAAGLVISVVIGLPLIITGVVLHFATRNQHRIPG